MFYVAGVNYRKADTALRGRFALDDQMIQRALTAARQAGIKEAFILSTCNRTEIYGLAHSAEILIHFLCMETMGSATEFSELAYIRKQAKAAEHLFEVAAGLDSQILGDYEIVGQIRTAIKKSKQQEMIGSYLDRLVNIALQSSKEIKNNTALSGGTLSVSFAAVQAAKQAYGDITGKKIVLVGSGKIGSNTCRNLVEYGKAKDITIINRTEEKAAALAGLFGLRHTGMDLLAKEIAVADIIITATSNQAPIISGAELRGHGKKLVIDLSVPMNVDAEVSNIPGIKLISVDELSRLKDDTINQRLAEVPKARLVIQQHLNSFMEWNQKRRYAPVLNHLKTTLLQLHQDPSANVHTGTCMDKVNLRIKQVVSDTAKKLEVKDTKGCDLISALNQFMN